MNRHTIRIFTICCFTILFPLLVSCSSNVKNLETDASFTHETIMKGGFCILGCTSIPVQKSNDMVISRYQSKLFREALLDKHEGIEVLEWGDSRRIIGDELLNHCFIEIRDFDSIAPALLDSLTGALLPDARYAIIHRIESDRLKYDKVDDKELKDGEWVVTGQALQTERIVSATFSIYDLQQGIRVCHAAIEGKDKTQRRLAKGEDVEIGGFLGDVIDAVEAVDKVLGDDEDDWTKDFPKPPRLDVVMKKIYKNFAKELPKG